MSALGLQINGILGSSNGGSPPSTTDFTPFLQVAGQPGGPTPGTNTFTLLNYASGLVYFMYNDQPVTLNVGFTITGGGVVTMLTGDFAIDDVVAGQYVGS